VNFTKKGSEVCCCEIGNECTCLFSVGPIYALIYFLLVRDAVLLVAASQRCYLATSAASC